jgi:hypothetical protein
MKASVWRALMKNKVVRSFFSEEPMKTGNFNLLGIMENTTLCHVPVGTVFPLEVHHLTSPITFLDKEFPDY